MAFVDKLKDVTNKVADGVADAAGTAKYKLKVSSENKEMEADFAKIGKIYYELSINGENLVDEAASILSSIETHKKNIADLEAKIKEIEETEIKIV